MSRKKRRRRVFQVTCRCSRYSFPHRITGGKCTGAAWAASYQRYDGERCNSCLENIEGICAVAEGRELVSECEGFQDVMHEHRYTKYPCTEDDYFRRYDAQHNDFEV